MRIYVAASWSRQKTDAQALADILTKMGHTITSGWLKAADGADQAIEAENDYNDVMRAEALVCITGDTESKGGRHTELGLALALQKRVYIVGPREQVFHHHPRVTVFATVEEMIERLR